MSWDDEVGAGAPATQGVWVAGEAELRMQEPPLAGLFRSLDGTNRHTIVCSLDGSSVKGLVRAVNSEGTVVMLVNGEHEFHFDVAAVTMVQIARPEGSA